MNEVEAPYLDAHVAAYPIEYIAGIDLYNAGEFHAAHDAWEERWMGEVGPKEKLFLQAMIQSAVAFHHLLHVFNELRLVFGVAHIDEVDDD